MTILRKDGTAHIRLIAPGKGSSGVYEAEMLKRVAPRFTEAFQFWDHAPADDVKRQPEGSLRNLAGKIIGTPKYEENGKIGPGLYADVKVYEPYRAAVESMGSDIGVSIRANGTARKGMFEGQKVDVIEDISSVLSVDWVTRPGAGGRAIELFEAARNIEPPAPAAEKPKGASTMETEWDAKALQEAQRIQAEEITQLKESLARANEREQLREAEDVIRRELGRAELHDLLKARLASDLVKHLPLTEAGTVDQEKLVEQVHEAVKREAALFTAVTGGGRIHGMGSSGDLGYAEDQVKAAQARLEESFKRWPGMSADAAKIAATGRR